MDLGPTPTVHTPPKNAFPYFTSIKSLVLLMTQLELSLAINTDGKEK